MPEPLLTIPETCRVLNLGRTTIYALIKSGELPAVHFGRAIRIPCQSCVDLVDRKVAEAATT